MRTCECKAYQGGEQLRGGHAATPGAPQQVWGHSRSHGKCGVTAVLGAHSRSVPSGHGRGHTQHAVVPAGAGPAPLLWFLSLIPTPAAGAWGALSRVPVGERAEGQQRGQPSSQHFLILMSWLAAQVSLQHGFSGRVIYILCQFLVCIIREITLLWKEKEEKGQEKRQQAWFL